MHFRVTHGIRVTDAHVALCAAPSKAATMPIEGGFSFTGSSVKSSLDYSIAIEALRQAVRRARARPCATSRSMTSA